MLHDLAEIPSSDYQAIREDLRVESGDLIVGSGSTPVVYGHYWREWGEHGRGSIDWKPLEGLDWTPTTACVDFSAVKGGPLVAYQWNQGDKEIIPTRFVPFR
jgi:hypothetical protein